MIAAFGQKWVRDHGDTPADVDGSLTLDGAIWQRGLPGITDQQVREGFERTILQADEWPPTLPRFRGLALGIPSLAMVKLDLRANPLPGDRGPFTRLVWDNIDHHALGLATVHEAERMVRDAYQAADEYVRAGGKLPEAVPALPPAPTPVRTYASDDVVQKHIAEAKAAIEAAEQRGLGDKA